MVLHAKHLLHFHRAWEVQFIHLRIAGRRGRIRSQWGWHHRLDNSVAVFGMAQWGAKREGVELKTTGVMWQTVFCMICSVCLNLRNKHFRIKNKRLEHVARQNCGKWTSSESRQSSPIAPLVLQFLIVTVVQRQVNPQSSAKTKALTDPAMDPLLVRLGSFAWLGSSSPRQYLWSERLSVAAKKYQQIPWVCNRSMVMSGPASHSESKWRKYPRHAPSSSNWHKHRTFVRQRLP